MFNWDQSVLTASLFFHLNSSFTPWVFSAQCILFSLLLLSLGCTKGNELHILHLLFLIQFNGLFSSSHEFWRALGLDIAHSFKKQMQKECESVEDFLSRKEGVDVSTYLQLPKLENVSFWPPCALISSSVKQKEQHRPQRGAIKFSKVLQDLQMKSSVLNVKLFCLLFFTCYFSSSANPGVRALSQTKAKASSCIDDSGNPSSKRFHKGCRHLLLRQQ